MWLTDVINLPGNIARVLNNQEIIMATLADIKAAVDAEKTVVDSAVALLEGLTEKIKNLEPNQEAIDALAAEIAENTQELTAAITANTPSE